MLVFFSWEGSWEDHLSLTKLSYNNSYGSSTNMVPFEDLYGRRCISPICLETMGEMSLIGLD